MKRLFTLLLCIACLSATAQWSYFPHLEFDGADTLFRKLIVIDTVNYPHNIWQIGKPGKAVFSSAFSAPNAIVTDTLNTYGGNDTSVFILKLPKRLPIPGWLPGPFYQLEFYYQLNIDSGVIAQLEMSADSAVTWYNLNDTLPFGFSGNFDSTTFSISTPGWVYFDLFNFSYLLDTALFNDGYDSILFRFTFISDSTPGSHDGWMIDNIRASYAFESVPQLENSNLLSIYPNPSKGHIYLHAEKRMGDASISVYDMLGRKVFVKDDIPCDGYLDLHLPDGVYTLRYATEEEYCVKKLIISD